MARAPASRQHAAAGAISCASARASRIIAQWRAGLDRAGQGANGQVAVTAALWTGGRAWPLGALLYLPAAWTDDTIRRHTHTLSACTGMADQALAAARDLSWTLDHVGPLCKTVDDAAVLLAVTSGFDPLDPASVDRPAPDYTRALRTRAAKLRMGLPRAGFFDDLHLEVAMAVNDAIDVLRRVGVTARDVTLPAAGNLLVPIMGPEAYAYHARWLAESPHKYQPQTSKRLVQLASAASREQYVEARRQCDLLRRESSRYFLPSTFS